MVRELASWGMELDEAAQCLDSTARPPAVRSLDAIPLATAARPPCADLIRHLRQAPAGRGNRGPWLLGSGTIIE